MRPEFQPWLGPRPPTLGLAAGLPGRELPAMSDLRGSLQARARAELAGDALDVTLGGSWQITEPRPSWKEVLGAARPKRVVFRIDGLEQWDSSLLLLVFEAQQWCRAAGAYCDADALPER